MTGMKKKLLNRAKALLIKRRFSFTVFKLSFKTSDKIEDISRYWNETNKSFMSGGGGGGRKVAANNRIYLLLTDEWTRN